MHLDVWIRVLLPVFHEKQGMHRADSVLQTVYIL